MKCPFCGSDDTQVKDSRPTEDSTAIRRRRSCGACGARFTTFERVQLRELSVLKAGGRREPLDRDKLSRSMSIALRKRAVEPDRIERAITGIIRRIESSGQTEVTSKQVGELVMDALLQLDQVAYIRFASVYRNFREAQDLRILSKVSVKRKRQMLSDERFMRVAIALARRGQGNVAPNPSVGCVIVNGGNIVGRGWTQPGGRPHAETEALKRAGARAAGATAYITLEPCAHQGKTQPCAQALIDAKISRAVLGPLDPDPRVDGAGIKILRAAEIEVIEGVCQNDAESVAAGFFKRARSGRPLVTLKIATTLDGKIATAVGESKWITGDESRAIAHAMRARHDAVLVGGHTVFVDNPALTCRLPGLDAQSPVRVILDGNNEIPRTHTLLKTSDEISTWIMVPRNISKDRRARYIDAGADVIDIDSSPNGKPDLGLALSALGKRGITRLMVEGGGRIIAGFMRDRLADFLVWFRTPMVIGADGISGVAALGIQKLDEAPNFVKLSTRTAGDDVVETYVLSR